MNPFVANLLKNAATPEDVMAIVEGLFAWYTGGSGTITLNPPIDILGKSLSKITLA